MSGRLWAWIVFVGLFAWHRRPENPMGAIMSGVGGWPGVIANAELDPRIRNGALGFTGAVQDLPAYTVGGSNLLVFSLPKPAQAAEAPKEKP